MSAPPSRVPLFQVDAFTSRLFRGNPAAVMVLSHFETDEILQAIAAENNLSETAFLVPTASDYRIRWFTPVTEVPLCGHATLASAAVVMERLEPGRERVVFYSASGPLEIERKGSIYAMDFPARPCRKIAPVLALDRALGESPADTFENEFNYMAVLDSDRLVRDLTPDMDSVARLDRPGLIVTAAGTGPYDFVSRYFAPAKGIPEDPVTGAAHCTLAPYWAERLGRTRLRAYQASKRGGEVGCVLKAARVSLEGSCAFYLDGQATIPA